MGKCTVLIVDENESRAMSLAAALLHDTISIVMARDCQEGLAARTEAQLHAMVVQSDSRRADDRLAAELQARHPHARLVCGKTGQIYRQGQDRAGECEGRADAKTVAAAVVRAIDEALQAERAAANSCGSMCGMIGRSPEIKELFSMIERLASTDATVMVLGESGTGKELVARSLHEMSPRRHKNFVAINCAAIPEELLESELFGHKKGSFTGACVDKVGKFEMADKGTLFLDEIGDMKPSLQVKLLRVLQSREIIPVGGTKPQKVDVRIVAATHQDLEAMVAEKTFRQDLYYRLSVVPLINPPLRCRTEDIPLLLAHFAAKSAAGCERQISFTDAALEALSRYEWPGNVRELENFVERMTIMSRSTLIDIGDLPPRYLAPAAAAQLNGDQGGMLPSVTEAGLCLNSVIDSVEERLISDALRLTGGNKKEAALLLNLKRTTLVEKAKRLGIDQNPPPPPTTTTTTTPPQPPAKK